MSAAIASINCPMFMPIKARVAPIEQLLSSTTNNGEWQTNKDNECAVTDDEDKITFTRASPSKPPKQSLSLLTKEMCQHRNDTSVLSSRRTREEMIRRELPEDLRQNLVAERRRPAICRGRPLAEHKDDVREPRPLAEPGSNRDTAENMVYLEGYLESAW
ncbi:hypothetical protein AJ79_09317 [Helicocarpus griseus UAMH5409]|uniref:Uncharacterized protein n=1 Tax=Helicocarpus griseus UAMH5409 TaxID=1447875 RepID=A0A2B7WKW7_9EURO|nr:hypothetical protein AJ79_09317 [Helicocarpus griseus UAMH5409]